VAARGGAQQTDRVRRVGALGALAADDPEDRLALRRSGGATAIGWIDGQNVRIDSRWGAGDADDIRKNAKELVALAPDVIWPLAAQLSGTRYRSASARIAVCIINSKWIPPIDQRA